MRPFVGRAETLLIALPVGALAAAAAALSARSSPFLAVMMAGLLAAVALAYVWPMRMLLVGIVLIPFHDLQIAGGGVGGERFTVTPAEAIMIVAAIGWLLQKSARGERIVRNSPLLTPLALLLVTTAAGLAVAEQPAGALKVVLMWTAFLVLFQMVVTDGDARLVRNVLFAISIAAAMLGALAIAGGTAAEVTSFGLRAEGRALATFGSPNRLGEFLALAIPLQIALAFRGPSAWRPIAIATIALSLVGLALTLSRAAWIGLAAGLLLLLIWRRFRYTLALATVAGILAFAALSPVGSSLRTDVLVQRVESIGFAGSNPRVIAYQKTPKLILDHPVVGIGANQYPTAAERYGIVIFGQPIIHAHNTPLHIAAERGVIGLAALAWAVIVLARLLVVSIRRLEGTDRIYAVALASSFVTLAVAALADYALEANEIASVAFVLAACVVVLARGPARA